MDFRALISDPAVEAARTRIRALEAATLREQLQIVAIPAPPLQEEERARYLFARFHELGLEHVHRDAVGNVTGCLPGAPASAGSPVVLSAHLDTVFPVETDLRPRHVGERIFAPGITDNARGLAALLAVARVLVETGLPSRHPVWFVATVGEEGLGDLRGSKHLFREGSPLRDAAAFIALDGSGIRRVVHRAIGARRLRATVRGPGGHSWADWGAANPIHALGVAIAALRRSEIPSLPLSTLTVTRMGGGTSVNAIPEAAWIELDIRSEDTGVLDRLEAGTRQVLAEAVEEENRRRRERSAPVVLQVEMIGDRPAGAIAESDRLVRMAMAATRAVGGKPELAASSTDANVPISLGIPAVTLGAGGESGGIHTLEEWFANREGAKGLERALLTLVAAASG